MSNAPVYHIEPVAFRADPYPDLARLRAEAPVAFVPELGATLITRRNDIFENEKLIEVFSSEQPGGLMTRLMGQNMMRKDGWRWAASRANSMPSRPGMTMSVIRRSKARFFKWRSASAPSAA